MDKRNEMPESLIHRYEIIEAEEFRKIIEEAMEIIYSDFCQHPKDSFYCASNDDLKPLTEAA
jgi:hypothetical protein